ncbi:AAA family ATPase [Sulfitobacter sp. DSM 110093]|uniref:AAA family ATPase n=1 Tax=Sulfitobacter sp. DSM 110093 TaxID=2883127 RepID=UPI001FAC9E65|nr:AAA family ATPase [Sulfitobacter sp. DSM 110093]
MKQHLINFREKMGKCKSDNQISDRDRRNIQRKIAAYRDAVSRRSGMGHLADKDRQRLEMFRNGATLVHVESEHRADEIASAIHCEMPWMAEATERIWQDMRASVRNGDAAPRLKPLLLVGPPGIGKTYWARALAQHLMVPTSVIEATGEPASFSVTGSQRGWGSAGPGKPLESIMASGVANPVVVVDEIEKAGTVESRSGQRFNLSEGLLPLLERSTATQWSCPYFRVSFDMSWITWIMTANSVDGLSAPFLSRCPPLTIPPLSMEHLLGFADRLGAERNLPPEAVYAVNEVIKAIKAPQLISLRSVAKMLDSVEQVINRPNLH